MAKSTAAFMSTPATYRSLAKYCHLWGKQQERSVISRHFSHQILAQVVHYLARLRYAFAPELSRYFFHNSLKTFLSVPQPYVFIKACHVQRDSLKKPANWLSGFQCDTMLKH
jgi:hypothetical protein